MDISIYFEPVNEEKTGLSKIKHKQRLGKNIVVFKNSDSFPACKEADIAIIGVQEDRKSFNNEGCQLGGDYVRKYLYTLFKGAYHSKIVDLGNIKKGHTVDDTYFAVSTVITELLKTNTLPIIIGGGHDLTYANYLAYEKLGKIINISTIDAYFDIGKAEKSLNSRSYLSKIILHQPNYLFNYTNIGYQTYFVDSEAIELMKKLYFDIYRLGEVRTNIAEVEPIVRNADMLSFDITSIRQSDAPGNANTSPNGFYGEEACQICRYAGLSDKLTSIGFYEYNPAFDRGEQTAHLISQMIWYFIEGYYTRKNDFPFKNKSGFYKYRVALSKEKEIVFYKSKKSERWWMEVPCPSDIKDKYERHHIVPCSYTDYQCACNDEIPDRWWQVYQKLI